MLLQACLCEHGDEEELLNVEDMDEETLRASLYGIPDDPAIEALYSKVNKQPASNKQQPTGSTTSLVPRPHQYEEVDLDSQMRPIPGYEWVDPQTRQIGDNNNEPKADSKPGLLRPKSVPGQPQQRAMSEFVTTDAGTAGAGACRTLPTGFKDMDKSVRKSTIRRIIRNELEAVFSDYETPQNLRDGGGASGASGEDIGDIARAGVGIGTLRGIMREELDKYRRENLMGVGMGGGAAGAASGDVEWEDNEDYESLYETLNTMPPAPPPPGQAPPLPPRNPGEKPEIPPRSPSISKAAAAGTRTSAVSISSPKTPTVEPTIPLEDPPPPPVGLNNNNNKDAAPPKKVSGIKTTLFQAE